MRAFEIWRELTTPQADAPAPRSRKLLLHALAALAGLSLCTQALQIARFAFDPAGWRLAWWVPNFGVFLTCACLLVLVRRGRGVRVAGWVVTSALAALAVTLLLAEGPNRPMWSMVAAAHVVLAVTLLPGRGPIVAPGILAVVALSIVALFQFGAIGPLAGAEQRTPVTTVGTLGLTAVLVFVAFISWLHLRHQREAPGAGAGPVPTRQRTAGLSRRELEIVTLVAAGRSNDAIAAELVVSPRTVQTHVANAMRKTACANRTELGVLAVREGIVPLSPVEVAAGGSAS